MKLKENKVKSLVENTINNLIKSVEDGQSNTLTNYLQAMGRFHHYSVTNIMLISRQFPTATNIAGFQTWKKLNHFILKGEKGIKIIAPMISKKESLKDEQEVFGFRIVNVFDISQTGGEELPEISKVNGDPTAYSLKLNGLIKKLNIKLEYRDDIDADGFSTGGNIIIKSGLSPADDFSVRIHELAHELLHHKKEQKLSNRQKETEAEAVAFVVCHEIGLDTNTASTDYIQLYDGDKKTLLQSFERIQKTSSEILYKLTSITNTIKGANYEQLKFKRM